MILTMKFERKNELLKALKEFPRQVMENTRLALKVSAMDIQEGAQQNHEFKTQSGNLERSISTQFDSKRLIAKVGLDDGVAPYGRVIHDGFKKKKFNRRSRRGRIFVVNHPGLKPDPFIINSAKDNSPKFQKRMRDVITNASRKAGL